MCVWALFLGARGWEQESFVWAIGGAVPQSAGDDLVFLVEPFAVIGQRATADIGALSCANFFPPVGICQALSSGRAKVSGARIERVFHRREVL